MNGSAYPAEHNKLGWIAFLFFCVGVATLAILGITSHDMGSRASNPVDTSVTTPTAKPGTTSAILTATPTPTRLARGR